LRARLGNGYYLTLVRDDGITKQIQEIEQEQQHQQQQQLQQQQIDDDQHSNSLEEVKTIFCFLNLKFYGFHFL
jgi:hypothetical protein